GNAAQCAFGGIVAEADATIVEEAREGRPALEQVVHRLRDIIATSVSQRSRVAQVRPSRGGRAPKPLDLSRATVDKQLTSGDEAAVVRSKEKGRTGTLLRIAETP